MNASALHDYTKKLLIQSTVLFTSFCNLLIKNSKLVFTRLSIKKILFLTQKQTPNGVYQGTPVFLDKIPDFCYIDLVCGCHGGNYIF